MPILEEGGPRGGKTEAQRRAERAIEWGMKEVTNPTQDWYRRCLSFVRQALGLNGLYLTAGEAWDNAQYKHPVNSGINIPAGVPVFWETSGTADHVALSIGGGKCLSNDIKRSGKIDVVGIDELTRSWNCDLQGWTEDLNGVHLGTGTTGAFAGSTGDAFGGDVDPLVNVFNWTPTPSAASTMLVGARALMNDEAVLKTVQMLCNASMRSFMAAPNGDFIAWFPDYFGHYGTAAKMVIRDIELAKDGFTITWDDSRLVTHQFTAGAPHGYSTLTPTGGAVTIAEMAQTGGVASVEFPELMEALFNVNKKDRNARSWLDPEAILQRFGARVDYQSMGTITGPEAEFWYACHLFQRNWASQFSAKVDLTFMPEVWPGMLLRLETFGFQAYVEQVTHTFSFSDGGGFSTEAHVIAPSATKGGGLYALPRANRSAPKRRPPKQGGRGN